MALDVELAGVLREVVQFLECLREAKLPVTLESIRENLLLRSKDTLASFMAERIGRPISPEAYLNMNAGSKGLLPTKTEAELQEYVGAENPRVQKQLDHYETFQEVEATNGKLSVVNRQHHEDREMTLVDIYASMSAAQTRSKCQKCGPLYRKEGKKLFVFEQYRACWVGLLGLHLLIYGNDRDTHPYSVQPIHGYMARAAPNSVPRDQRRSESAFEIFCPGSRTLQFVARTPKDMEQWVDKICQLGCCEKNEKIGSERTSTFVDDSCEGNSDDNEDADKKKDENGEDVVQNINGSLIEAVEHSTCMEERYQDVGLIDIHKTTEDSSIVPEDTDNHCDIANPPPLPARIPRRLPSVPTTDSTSYEPPEDEEDDIYHKIEDFRESVCYQNLKKSSKIKSDRKKPDIPPTTYDDVRATKKGRTIRGEKSATETETYDDIGSALNDQDKLASYDDVENLTRNVNSSKSPTTQDSTKSPQKKSFLDRVRSRKGSPRKVDKKVKGKTPPPQSTNAEELPTYDDVSGLANPQDNKPCEQELPEYNCPPPPRPISGMPSAVPDPIECQEMVYDDVGACHSKHKEEEMKKKLDQKVTGKLENHGTGIIPVKNEGTVVEEKIPEQLAEDIGHYQTPRSESCRRTEVLANQQEELYDDIALLADFRARQKEFLGRRDAEDSIKFQENHDKKTWNRFVSSRKTRWGETTGGCETFAEVEDADDHGEHRGLTRMNTFQKLISKMENTLGKSSARTTSSTPLNKTNVATDT